MFTNCHITRDHGFPQQSEASTFETLKSEVCFDVLDEFDPSVVSDLSFKDLIFLNALLTPASSPRKYLLSDNDHHSEVVLTPKESPPSSVPNACQKTPDGHRTLSSRRELLLAQVRHLEIEASLLHQQSGVEDPEAEATKRALNFDLRNAVLQHDLLTASTQSALSGYVTSRATSPLDTYIHLGTDWNQRRSVLLEMRDRKIAVVHQFLTERTHHMNPFKPSCEVFTFGTEQGDVCTVKVDVTSFEGARSVREVFDVLQFYFANMEMSKTELSGKVTIHENEASVDDLVMQHRVVTSEGLRVSQESNLAVFYDTSGLETVNADEQYVVITGDSVDRDDIYPYRSSARVRKDVSSVMKLSTHRRRRRPQAIPGSDDDEDELMVVFTRTIFVRLHRPQFDVPKDAVQSITDDLVSCIDVMIKSVRAGLNSAKQEVNVM